MVLIEGEIGGKKYREPFSKGILSKSLVRAEIDSAKAYEMAAEIEKYYMDNSIDVVQITDLVEFVKEKLNEEDPELAKKYISWKKIRQSEDPLIILIGGASGIGTSSISFELATKLGIKNMLSTDMIRRKNRIIQPEDNTKLVEGDVVVLLDRR